MAKPKVFISSDIGGSDPDDKQSMAHFLTHADKFDIKGFVSTPTGHSGRTSHIHQALDAYAKDYAKLDTWGDYPDPAYLKSIVYQGNLKVAPSAGWSTPTAGSKAIIAAAKQASAGDPLYILAWGALTDVAQAIHDDPSIKGNIRILASNGWNYTQDPNAYNYVINNFAKQGGWMIDSKSTHRGIYLDSSGGANNGYDMNNIKGHGALGDYMYNAQPWGIKMGDSWSVAYLLDSADNNNPTLTTSWGGTFVKNGLGSNYYTDDPSSSWYHGGYKGAKHVYAHQKTIYNDMSANFDKAKASNPNGGSSKPPSDGGTSKSPSDGGKGNPVVAVDDSYKIDAGEDLWVSTKYLVMNDKGADGGLKIAAVSAKSQHGFTVSFDSAKGIVHYDAAPGWNGVDRVDYTLKDKDGSTDIGSIIITVGSGGSGVSAAPPSAPPPPPSSGTSGGKGNPVVAVDDAYKVKAGQDLWVGTKYLLLNDKGADGGLKITDVAAKSQHGFKVSFDSAKGIVHYDVASGWNGTDRIDYTLKDKDGSTDTGSIVVTVGTGGSASPPPSGSKGGSTGGSGNPVVAVDDTYKPKVGKDFYFNTKYLTWNDKSLDGGLKVIALDKISAKGVKVSWDANGTAIYEAKSKGIDTLKYTVADADGSTDVGQIIFSVI